MKDEKEMQENQSMEEDVPTQNEAGEDQVNHDSAKENEPTEIEQKDIEIKVLNDKYLRLYSEFDNFRRRTQKEKLDLYKTAGEDIFKSLLSVMDDFERAKKSMEENQNYDSLKQGVDLIYNKFKSFFKSNGVEEMESSIGKDFDSEIQEAITQVPAPSKKMKGKVVDEVEKGYKLKDKVIRYAKVVVGQ
tara:strand:- start:118 stop:684 length:567 start_codon:yes stop_codon:yes gene_type:complete